MEMGGCYQEPGEWTLDVIDKGGCENNKTQKRGYDPRALGIWCWAMGAVLEQKCVPASKGTSPRAGVSSWGSEAPCSVAAHFGCQATFHEVGTQVGTLGNTWLRGPFRGRGSAPRKA